MHIDFEVEILAIFREFFENLFGDYFEKKIFFFFSFHGQVYGRALIRAQLYEFYAFLRECHFFLIFGHFSTLNPFLGGLQIYFLFKIDFYLVEWVIKTPL